MISFTSLLYKNSEASTLSDACCLAISSCCLAKLCASACRIRSAICSCVRGGGLSARCRFVPLSGE